MKSLKSSISGKKSKILPAIKNAQLNADYPVYSVRNAKIAFKMIDRGMLFMKLMFSCNGPPH